MTSCCGTDHSLVRELHRYRGNQLLQRPSLDEIIYFLEPPLPMWFLLAGKAASPAVHMQIHNLKMMRPNRWDLQEFDRMLRLNHFPIRVRGYRRPIANYWATSTYLFSLLSSLFKTLQASYE
jgi:hypothetical protein